MADTGGPGEGSHRARKAQETNRDANNAYLQGRYFFDRRGKEDVEKAIGYFELALKIDSDYAPAWVGLSAAHSRQADQGYVPAGEGYGKARMEVQKALELDLNLASAHARMGSIKRVYDWDWTGADAAYKRAVQLEPANADAIGGAAGLAATVGRFDEGIVLERRAIELDPLRVATHFNLGFEAYYAGRLHEAKASVQKALELNPQSPAPRP